MSSYDNRYNDIDDEPDFDYVNDDYGFDMDDDKEPSARTSTGASKNHKRKGFKTGNNLVRNFQLY